MKNSKVMDSDLDDEVVNVTGEGEELQGRDRPEERGIKRKTREDEIKVIRKFFIKHNKSFRWHLGDYEKHNFFSI